MAIHIVKFIIDAYDEDSGDLRELLKVKGVESVCVQIYVSQGNGC